jgi:hypothetical protein
MNDPRPAHLRTTQEVEASKNTDQPIGYLGISPAEYVVSRYTWSAPIVAGGLISQFTELTLKGLGTALASLFSGNTRQGNRASGRASRDIRDTTTGDRSRAAVYFNDNRGYIVDSGHNECTSHTCA